LPFFALEALMFRLLQIHRRAAVAAYLAGGILILGAAVRVLNVPNATHFYTLLTLSAVVMAGPLVGIAVASAGAAATCLVLMAVPILNLLSYFISFSTIYSVSYD
jgi:hypothetical protein